MQIRDPRMPMDPADPTQPDAESLRCRVSATLPVLKFAGAAALMALAVLLGAEPVSLVLAGAAALGLVAWAVRDLVAPVRVAADRTGVTVVVGYAGRRHLTWPEVERVRVDTRPRFGLRTETLEIDTGEALHLFSSYDLGAPPAEVAARLDQLRATS